MIKNPFENTKASYMSDEEILSYWTDINNQTIISTEQEEVDNTELEIQNYHYIMNPRLSLPIFILGSKGSGKTHLLRYFSLELQERDAEDNDISLLEQIKKDQYLGILFTSSSFEFQMFQNNGDSNSVYIYYSNLVFIEVFFVHCNKLFECINDKEHEKKLLAQLAPLFFPRFRENIINISDLQKFLEFITDTRMNLEEEILMSKANKTYVPNYKFLFNPTPSFFQKVIKYTFSNTIDLKDIHILFMIDEFENFDEYQQKYINTCLRHPEYPDYLSIRICGRLYSIKTDETFDDNEPLMEGAEKKTSILDKVLSSNNRSGFTNYASQLAINRIRENIKTDLESNDFLKLFKDLDRENYFYNILNSSQKDNEVFSKKLISYLEQEGFVKTQINNIIKKLFIKENLFLSKLNFLLLYKSWYKSPDLIKRSTEIQKSLQNLLNNKKNFHQTQIDHHGVDMLYQVYKDTKNLYNYCGFDSIINMSEANPRNYLTILSNLHRHCTFKNINMFEGDEIPITLQNKAMRETSEWFWNDIHKYKNLIDNKIFFVLERLCHFFRLHRISDKPVEKTLISFSFDINNINKDILKIIDDAVKHSIFIEQSSGKKTKNEHSIIKQYSINAMFSPKWDLPLQIGGTIELKKEEIHALFDEDKKSWERYRDIRLSRYNYPFKDKISNSLFDTVIGIEK